MARVPTEETAAARPVYDLVTARADYPPWDGRPRRAILLCSHMRSGSTLLGEAMYATGCLGCPIEYFHRGFQPHLAERWQTQDFADYLATVYRWRTDPSGTLGVKLFWGDVEALCFQAWPNEEDQWRAGFAQGLTASAYARIHALLTCLFPNPRWVYLRRRDRVRQAISLLRAGQTGTFRRFLDGNDPADRQPPEYDYDRILRYVGLSDYCHAHWQQLFDAAILDPYLMAYEELAQDFSRTVGGLFHVLGLGDAVVTLPRLQRQADRLSEEFLAQFLSDYQRRNGQQTGERP
jgi:LPS sulfotransferase NodH